MVKHAERAPSHPKSPQSRNSYIRPLDREAIRPHRPRVFSFATEYWGLYSNYPVSVDATHRGPQVLLKVPRLEEWILHSVCRAQVPSTLLS
jgi:hypothetical protein